jgi:hypothetical protein
MLKPTVKDIDELIASLIGAAVEGQRRSKLSARDARSERVVN